MNYLFITFVAICVNKIEANSIISEIKAYFDSDIVKSYEKKWNEYYIYSFENAIAYALKEGYGHKTMNVYVNRFHKPLLVASGYYHTDNQVKLVFKDMVLEALPHLYDVDISFPLASNVILAEASVSKMILHTSYVLFRNQSDIIFSTVDQDPYKSSPFRFQQVRNVGDLAISIEGCSFSGAIVATLAGNSVILGHSELRLKDCQYSIEIYKYGSGSPPVIANYLPRGESGLNLETLLSRTMLEELVPKLQGALFSEVNTSAVFTEDLPKIRGKQEVLFENMKNYMDDVVRNMNRKSIEKNMGSIELEDFAISWDDMFTELPTAKSLKLTNLTLLGLDTIYSSHSGGPILLTEIEIIEQLRFSTLQVIGKVSIEGFQDDNEFAVEISDLAVDVNMALDHTIKFEVLGWRFLEFSCPELEFLPTESLVVGYLLNEVPKHIKSHLSSVYTNRKISKLTAENTEEQAMNDPINVDVSEIDENKKQLNEKVENDGHVKLHHVKVKPHVEEQDIVQLNDQTGDRLHIKLLHANAEPHKVDSGHVKLHNVQAEPHVEDKGAVKLHHVAHVPHTEDNEPINKISQLNDPQVKEYTHVKQHHVGIAPRVAEERHVKLNYAKVAAHTEDSGAVKLHHTRAKSHSEDLGSVKLHYADAVHDDETPGENEEKKLHKRTKLDTNRKMFTKPIHKPTRRIKFARDNRRANKGAAVTLKTTHISDNEVH